MKHNTTSVTLSQSVLDCRVDSAVLGEAMAANACLSTPLVFVMADERFKHQQEILLFFRVSSCLKSGTRCSLLVQSYKFLLSWGSPSLVPQTVIASPVPNHAECLHLMSFDGAVATVGLPAPCGKAVLQFTATQQLQPTSSCKHGEASFTWCLGL